jgi:hypothetical protein
MAQFLSKVELEMLGSYKFKLLNPIVYADSKYTPTSTTQIVVPAGFVTDLATIPRLFWSIMPPDGEYAKAAIIHDFLYTNNTFERYRCDQILEEAMEITGVDLWKRKVIYAAVRLFGASAYKK